MRAMTSLLIFVLLSLYRDADAQQKVVSTHYVESGFLTVDAFRRLDDASRRSFVTGYVDGIFAAGFIGAKEELQKALKKCIARMDSEQVTEVLDNYVRDHPEEWREGATAFLFTAFINFCPALKNAP